MLFAITDIAFSALAVWLIQHNLHATGAVVNELFLRFVPFVLAGLTAGYLASPRGFSAAALAGCTGAIFSLAFRYNDSIGWAAQYPFNVMGMLGWIAGTTIASGICGWAGERLRTKGGALGSSGNLHEES
jgi:hypothetical protein